ncbi:unnamed protein product, partial [Thlaspi arvense]
QEKENERDRVGNGNGGITKEFLLERSLGLVAAFLDLSVAFSLLCASSLVYLTSKLLGVFGLSLPCPCDGLFSDPRKSKCFQESLVNLPVKRISSVQGCVRKRTPFDSILYKEANFGGKKRKGERRDVELEREVFCTSSVNEVESASGFDLLTSQSLKKGSFKIKSKRLSFHRSPYGLKNHWQSSLENKNSPQSPKDPLLVNSEALEEVSFRKSVSLSSFGGEACAQNKQPERTYSWAGGEGTYSSPVDLTYSGIIARFPNEILEQVLAEERSARAALALELEKERNAAATAADEALGMILRLQEEKTSVEMEARQYQRMIEEKSAFDAEEMSILKEILLRREKEKHFLEKEVDSYRQMFLQTEQPLLNTPQQMAEPLDEMETTDVSPGFEIFTNHMDSRVLALGDDDNADSQKLREVENTEEMNVNGVDQNPGLDQSGSEGLLIDISQDREECTSFPDIDCHVMTDEDNKVKLNVSCDHLRLDRSQSVSDTGYRLGPAFSQGQRNMSPTMRRNSMSAVDCERLKIESEVGLLRGRLRAVQKGREKRSFSSKEQSKSQVQRFGDKTSRFWPLESSSPASSTMVKAMSITLDLHSA